MAELPTEEELAKLPRWALVALLSRCAARLSPQFELPLRTNGLEEHVRAVLAATGFALESASTGKFCHGNTMTAIDAQDAAAISAKMKCFYANRVAVFAYWAYVGAGEVEALSDLPHITLKALETPEIRSIAINDFERLKQLALIEDWNNDTPVGEGSFGPLWPDGEPTWFTEGKEWQRKVLSGEIGGEASEQIVEAPTAKFVLKANEPSVAVITRSDLKLRYDSSRVPAAVIGELSDFLHAFAAMDELILQRNDGDDGGQQITVCPFPAPVSSGDRS